MCATLGGRAAEEIIFGKISTGALSDLEKVTKQAYAMITVYGLNDKIGNLSYYDSSGANEYGFTKPYSEKTAEVIDAEVSKMVELAYTRAKKILGENKHLLTQLAEKLLEKEVIFKEDLENIFGKRKFEKDIEAEATEKLEAEQKEKANQGADYTTFINGQSSTSESNKEEPKSEETKSEEEDKKDPEPPKTTLF
jgi:cell division protease FtsH